MYSYLNKDKSKEILTDKVSFSTLLEKLTKPLLNHYSEANTQLKWGNREVVYNQHIVGIEGFSRVLWGYSSLLSCNDEFSKSQTSQEFFNRTVEGLKNATNSSNTKYNWEKPGDFNQIYVEMGAISLFLLFNVDKIKQCFNKQELNDLIEYLSNINTHDFSKNNWQFFKVLVNIAIYKLNKRKYNEKYLFEALENIEKCYIGSGWYYDGRPNQKDYYIGWGYHYYGLIFNYFMKNEYPEIASKFTKRAILFYEDYKYFFDINGMQIPFGRSLIYRFAASSYFSALALNKIYPNGINELKWFITKNITFFTDNKENFDDESKLNLGFCYENHTFLEEYNSNTSPYWALKTFIILALDKKDEFWKAEIKTPVWEKQRKIDAINSIIYTTPEHHKILFNSGQYAKFNPKFNQEKYTKETYTTLFGPSISSNYLENDMQLYLSKDGLNWETKKMPLYQKIEGDKVVSIYKYDCAQVKCEKWFDLETNKINIVYSITGEETEWFYSFSAILLPTFKLFLNNKELKETIFNTKNTSLTKKDLRIINVKSDEKHNNKILKFEYLLSKN
ncbi:DUF2264 domain-containing protein [Mycoplasma crocodyli]|nr:DUF2264 domain-containing protein [Mycoplasma crocodyli]